MYQLCLCRARQDSSAGFGRAGLAHGAVWSTNWWVNQKYEIDLLHTKLTERLAEDRQRRKSMMTLAFRGQAINLNQTPCISRQPDKGHAQIAGLASAPVMRSPMGHNSESGVVEHYKIMDFFCISTEPSQFYEDSYDASLQEMIRSVVNIEGPIHELLLLQRIARAHSFKRAGTKC